MHTKCQMSNFASAMRPGPAASTSPTSKMQQFCCWGCRPNGQIGNADTFKKSDVLSIQQSIVNHVEYTIARSRYKFDNLEAYQAAAFSLRDRLIESWNDTQQYFK